MDSSYLNKKRNRSEKINNLIKKYEIKFEDLVDDIIIEIDDDNNSIKNRKSEELHTNLRIDKINESVESYNIEIITNNDYESINENNYELNSYLTNSSLHEKEYENRNKINHSIENSRYNYPYKINEIIGKYTILLHIAEGIKSSIFKVKNNINNRIYAMKIEKENKFNENISIYENEFTIASKILKINKAIRKYFVDYIDFFIYEKKGVRYNIYIEELLGVSLLNILKLNKYLGISIESIKIIAKSILKAISLLHKNKMKHCNLNTENILLINSEYIKTDNFDKLPKHISLYNFVSKNKNNKILLSSRDCFSIFYSKRISYKIFPNPNIKIIDFGAVKENDDINQINIPNYGYRSPEIILDCQKIDEKSDIWSIGCILLQLYNREKFFSSFDDILNLCNIEKVCGHFPNWMIENSSKNDLKKIFVNCRKHQFDKVINIHKFDDYKAYRNNIVNQPKLSEIIIPEHDKFQDLITQLLKINPNERISAKQALKHPFFKTEIKD